MPGLRHVTAVRRAYPTFGGMAELGAVMREMWPAGVQGTSAQVSVGQDHAAHELRRRGRLDSWRSGLDFSERRRTR